MAGFPPYQGPGCDAMSTSKKHAAFVEGPIGGKPVFAIPGIGPVLGQRLTDNGFTTAEMVLGKFLLKKRQQDDFNNWLHSITQANSKQQTDCYNGINTYYNNFLC